MAEEPFKDILARCLLRIEDEGIEVLESLCSEHPDIADRLRARVADLRGLKLVGDADTYTGTPGSASGEVNPDPRPESIGPYKILSVLGEGGMGTVTSPNRRSRSAAVWHSKSSSWAWTARRYCSASVPSVRPWR